MPSTTIHIPDGLLQEVDTRARALGLSRNRLILQAIRKILEEDDAWPEEFLAGLRRERTAAEREAVDEMLDAILDARSSKPAPEL